MILVFKDNKLIAKFKTATEASRKMGVNVSSIRACVSGRYNQAGGYQFYKEGVV